LSGQQVKAFFGFINSVGDAAFKALYFLFEGLIDGGRQIIWVEAAVLGEVALRVQVYRQDALSHLRQRRRQIHGGGGFADAALLHGYGDDLLRSSVSASGS
jgi:hypothetical protein